MEQNLDSGEKMKDGAFLILFKDDSRKEVFLVFRSDYLIWVLTGGGIEKGETPKSAAIREAEEESGFKVKLLGEIGVYHVLNKNGDLIRKTHFFEGRKVSGDFKPEFLGCKGEWFNIDNLPKDLTFRTKQKIIDAVNFSGKPFVKTVRREPFWENAPVIIRHSISSIKYIRDKYL